MNKNTTQQITQESQLYLPHKDSVIVYFSKELNDLDELHHFEEKLYELLDNSSIGYYDGHEVCIDLTHGSLYFYGPNAEVLFKTVKTLLESADFLIGAIAILTFRKEDGRKMSVEVTLGE